MSSQRLKNLMKAAGIKLQRLGRQQDFRSNNVIRKSVEVAQNGRLKEPNFKLAGWVNSCWVQFGQLGKLPKSKFTAPYPRNSTDQHPISSWNSLFVRTLRRRAEDPSKLTREKLPTSKSGQVPDFPPVPKRLGGMDRYNLLFKPIAFTAFVGTSSIVGCTIWQYEEYRCHVANGRFSLSNLNLPNVGECTDPARRRASQLGVRVQSWWNELTPAEKIFWPICSLNTLVCLAWRMPFLASTMVNYFSCSPMGRAVCWPMLFSTFSHYSVFHLAANMFVLHSFLPAAAQIMGREQFVAFYLTSGTLASLGSHLHKVLIGSSVPSLGASGAIMGVLGLVCTRMPDIQLGIIFLPGVQFTADTALKCILAIDIAGIVFGWRFMDHAAHLAGCLFGIGFSNWGKDTFWAFRDFVMTQWHKLRTQGGVS